MLEENHLPNRIAVRQADRMKLCDVLQFQRERTAVPTSVAMPGVKVFQANARHARLQAILRADVGRQIEHLDRRGQQKPARMDVEATLRAQINLIHAQRFTLGKRHRLAAVALHQNLRSQMDVDAAGIDCAIADVRNDALLNQINEFVVGQKAHFLFSSGAGYT